MLRTTHSIHDRVIELNSVQYFVYLCISNLVSSPLIAEIYYYIGIHACILIRQLNVNLLYMIIQIDKIILFSRLIKHAHCAYDVE